MERRGFRKSKRTFCWHFRVFWVDRGYECTEANGSLRPGKRQELYCPDCDAPECVFGGPTWKQIQAGAKGPEQTVKRPEVSRAAKKSAREMRARGLTPRGEPLKESCWNCVALRRDTTGYICRYDPLARPVCKSTVVIRTVDKTGCEWFGLRRSMEIPRL